MAAVITTAPQCRVMIRVLALSPGGGALAIERILIALAIRFRASIAVGPTINRPVCPRGCGQSVLNVMEGFVQHHKFKIGQSVSFTSGPFGRGSSNSIYKIVQLLPPEGYDYQYKIKSVNEPHERVVKESDLSRAT
jgi:hypothetical protein